MSLHYEMTDLIPINAIPLNGIPITEGVERPDLNLNSRGYDTKEFNRRGQLNFEFIGCSWTQGNHATGSFYRSCLQRDRAALWRHHREF